MCTAQSVTQPLDIGSVTVQCSLRTRVEEWQWFKGQGNSDYIFSGSLLRVMFSKDSGEAGLAIRTRRADPLRSA